MKKTTNPHINSNLKQKKKNLHQFSYFSSIRQSWWLQDFTPGISILNNTVFDNVHLNHNRYLNPSSLHFYLLIWFFGNHRHLALYSPQIHTTDAILGGQRIDLTNLHMVGHYIRLRKNEPNLMTLNKSEGQWNLNSFKHFVCFFILLNQEHHGKRRKNIRKIGPGSRGGLAEVQTDGRKTNACTRTPALSCRCKWMFLEVLHTFNSM